jgi:hypothetical protein
LLVLFALALFSSTIHAGWLLGGGAGLGFGDSGLFSAVSSQLAFVGLHLLVSIVFVGLEGGVIFSSWSFVEMESGFVSGLGSATAGFGVASVSAL